MADAAAPAAPAVAHAKAPVGSGGKAGDGSSDGNAADGAKPQLSGGQIRELRKKMRSCETKTATLRSKIEQTQADMAAADPTDFEALGRMQAQIAEYESQIETLDEQWLEAAEELGE